MNERDAYDRDHEQSEPAPAWFRPTPERDERELLIALLSGPAVTEEPSEDE